MKVKELIKILKKCNPDDLVIMSSDAEGNTYSPLADLNTSSSYESDITCSGSIGLRELTPELETQGYSERDVLKGENAVVLYPTN